MRRWEQAEGEESASSRGRRRRGEQQPRTGEGILDPRLGRRAAAAGERGRAWGFADLGRSRRRLTEGGGTTNRSKRGGGIFFFPDDFSPPTPPRFLVVFLDAERVGVFAGAFIVGRVDKVPRVLGLGFFWRLFFQEIT